LLYLTLEASLESTNIESYEVLACEPMHDIAGHITNIIEELPHHLPEQESALLKETINLTAEGKDKRGPSINAVQ
jgi:hypothetical protein